MSSATQLAPEVCFFTCEELRKLVFTSRHKTLAKSLVGGLWWEDILQETWVKLYYQNNIRDAKAVHSYIWRSVRNAAINYKRKQVKQFNLEDITTDFQSLESKEQLIDNFLYKYNHFFNSEIQFTSYMFKFKYEHRIKRVLEIIFLDLSPREKFLLYERFKKARKLGDISKVLHIHQCNVTRQLEHLCKKLWLKVATLLRKDYNMSLDEVEEALNDFVNNKTYILSVLTKLEESLKN